MPPYGSSQALTDLVSPKPAAGVGNGGKVKGKHVFAH